jgi:pimeloyl-ACP methyl ester carboxylesterase
MDIERKNCRAADGVEIVYSVCGAGDPALLFIHAGLADRTFWDGQLLAFGARHRVVAPDLPGHGESGANRAKWGIPEFGADIKAVADAENLEHVVFFGNSLGGPVAVEAALLMPDRTLAVVGVDTQARERASAFREDYAGGVRQMVKMLFHSDASPSLLAEAERRMQNTPPSAAYEMFASLGGYDPAAAARRLPAPLRAINGDLFPTDVQGVRAIKPDFEVTVMRHMGHYPMLERPDEFNDHIAAVLESLGASRPARDAAAARV